MPINESWFDRLKKTLWQKGNDQYLSSKIRLADGLTVTRVSENEVELGLADPTGGYAVWDPASMLAGRQCLPPLSMAAAGSASALLLPADGASARWSVNIPFGFRLTTVRALIDPETHVSMPATKPVLSVYTVGLSGGAWTQTLINAQTEPATAVVDYNPPHYINITGLTIDNSTSEGSSDPADQSHVEIVLSPEASTNADNLSLLGALYQFEVIPS